MFKSLFARSAKPVDPLAEEKAKLRQLIEEIGVCRFVGRVNSGLIDPSVGYAVFNDYVEETNKPKTFVERIMRTMEHSL